MDIFNVLYFLYGGLTFIVIGAAIALVLRRVDSELDARRSFFARRPTASLSPQEFLDAYDSGKRDFDYEGRHVDLLLIKIRNGYFRAAFTYAQPTDVTSAGLPWETQQALIISGPESGLIDFVRQHAKPRYPNHPVFQNGFDVDLLGLLITNWKSIAGVQRRYSTLPLQLARQTVSAA